MRPHCPSFSTQSLDQTPPPWNHKLKPQMTNRSQTRRFNCRNAEFRFFDGACAVTSIVDTIPQGHPAEGGSSCELLNWPRTLTECYPAFLSTLNVHFKGGPKNKAELVLETEVKAVRLITRSMASFFFGPGLVSNAAAAPNPHRKAFIWDWF